MMNSAPFTLSHPSLTNYSIYPSPKEILPIFIFFIGLDLAGFPCRQTHLRKRLEFTCLWLGWSAIVRGESDFRLWAVVLCLNTFFLYFESNPIAHHLCRVCPRFSFLHIFSSFSSHLFFSILVFLTRTLLPSILLLLTYSSQNLPPSFPRFRSGSALELVHVSTGSILNSP